MKKSFLLYSIIGILFFACDSNTIYQDFTPIGGQWYLQDTVKYTVSIEEVTNSLTSEVHVKYNASYQFYNLYLKLLVEDASNNLIVDELKEVILFEPKTGKPLGSGIGPTFTISSEILSDLKVEKPGEYKYKLVQYMRIDTLPEIESIGLKVYANRD